MLEADGLMIDEPSSRLVRPLDGIVEGCRSRGRERFFDDHLLAGPVRSSLNLPRIVLLSEPVLLSVLPVRRSMLLAIPDITLA